jgi:hypothetical protein
MPNGKRSFPGRMTLEEWLTLSYWQRVPPVRRAQADVLGSFRFCANKQCLRARTCRGVKPDDCRQRLRRRRKGMSKVLLKEWTRLDRLADL